MGATSGAPTVSTKLERIAKLAKEMPRAALTTLAHHIDLEWLYEAHRRTRKDGAAGVDGQTAEQYGAALEDNLRSLLGRVKSGTYRAPPVRRVHIPKGDGSQTRPIGIPSFEDKLLQRAVAMVLEAVYEQEFLDCSYGFRPRRSAHGALEALQNGLVRMAGGWVLEGDIKSFYDTMAHGQLQQILGRRVRDGVLLSLVGKWLNAGVLEAGELEHPEEGVPQGGVVSSILSNVYLHEVLDVWFELEVKPRLKGRAFLIRYADDFVIAFSEEGDARRVLAVLAKRFAKYGLTLHPEKTRLTEFRRPDRRPPAGPGGAVQGSGTFDLLGFTHVWGVSRKGKWVVKRRTAKTAFRRALRRIKDWCREHTHDKVKKQAQELGVKLRGHFGYFGIIGNSDAIVSFRFRVVDIWRKRLGRRSNRARMSWERMERVLRHHPLPPARIAHPYGQA